MSVSEHQTPVYVRAEVLARHLVLSMTIMVALCAAVLSYTGLAQLALLAGFGRPLALIFPLSIDGLMVVGAAGVLHAGVTGTSPRFAWAVTLVAVGLSVYGNAASVPDHSTHLWLDRAVRAIAPLSLALCVESAMLVLRNQTLDALAQERSQLLEAERQAKAAQRRSNARARTPTGRRAEPVSDEVLDRARQLQRAGASYAQIAQELPVRTRSGWHRMLTMT